MADFNSSDVATSVFKSMKRPRIRQKQSNLEKLNYIQLAESGIQQETICKQHNLAKSTLCTWIKNKEKIITAIREGQGEYQEGKDTFPIIGTSEVVCKQRKTNPKRVKELDEVLLVWFNEVRDVKVPVDEHKLLSKANEFAQLLGVELVNHSWLEEWMKRHNFAFGLSDPAKTPVEHQTLLGASALNGTTQSESRLNENVWTNCLNKYKPDNIFVMVETGPFFRANIDGTISSACHSDTSNRTRSTSSSQRAKDYITVALTSNIIGTEKFEPLVIGKYMHPQCFNNVKTLPVDYMYNSKGCMTSELFTSWLKKVDGKMAIQQRKIVLLVDDSPLYCQVDGLRSVELCVLPNHTKLLPSKEHGLTQLFKYHYCHKALQHIAREMQGNHRVGLRNSTIDLLQALRFVKAGWTTISRDCILRCYLHLLSGNAANCEPILTTEHFQNIQELIHQVDSNTTITATDLLSAESGESPDDGEPDFSTDSIVVGSGDDAMSFIMVKAEADEREPSSFPSQDEAQTALDTLKRYFESKPSSHKYLDTVYQLELALQ